MIIHEKYIDQMRLTELRRNILKVINGYPNKKLTANNINSYLIKLGYDIKLNTLYKNLEFLEENKFVGKIPFPAMGKQSRPPNFYKIIGIEQLECTIVAAVRCPDGHTDPAECNPMICTRKDCRKHMEYLERQT